MANGQREDDVDGFGHAEEHAVRAHHRRWRGDAIAGGIGAVAVGTLLAEAVLAGRGPDLAEQPAPGRAPFQKRSRFEDGSALTPGLIATYALIALLFLIGLWLAAHFTMNSH